MTETDFGRAARRRHALGVRRSSSGGPRRRATSTAGRLMSSEPRALFDHRPRPLAPGPPTCRDPRPWSRPQRLSHNPWPLLYPCVHLPHPLSLPTRQSWAPHHCCPSAAPALSSRTTSSPPRSRAFPCRRSSARTSSASSWKVQPACGSLRGNVRAQGWTVERVLRVIGFWSDQSSGDFSLLLGDLPSTGLVMPTTPSRK